MGVIVKRTGNLKDINQVKAHSKYVGFRSRELEDEKKGFFGRDSDFSDYKEFVKRIEGNKALKHPNAVKVHKLVFSLKQKDYEAYLKSGQDYKDLIRVTLKEYEAKNGVKLDWIASIHNAEGHPHAHVIIKAVSDEKDKDGKYKRIYFKKDDFKDMRDQFDKEFEKEAEYIGFDKLDDKDFERTVNDIAKGFEAVIKDLQRDIDKEEYKAEIKKDRDIREKIRKDKQNDRER